MYWVGLILVSFIQNSFERVAKIKVNKRVLFCTLDKRLQAEVKF